MPVAAPHDRDLAMQRIAVRDYSERALQLRVDAWAALRAGLLIRSAKLEQAAKTLDRAAAAERLECDES